jgi:hypothetical protein
MTAVSSMGALRKALARLEVIGVIPRASGALEHQQDAALEGLLKTVADEVPAFSATGNPDVMPELKTHIGDHVQEILRLFTGGQTGDFEFVAKQSARRAQQKFPLEAMLHAYRCGHKVLSRWMRNAATESAVDNVEQTISAVADFAIEYTNTISTIATSEYVAQTRRLAEVEGDRRTELLNALVQGFDESDGRVARLLRRAGYLEQRQSFCVIAVQPVIPTEMDNPARAERMVGAINERVAMLPVRTLLGVRDNLVIGIFSATRRMSGWTEMQTTLAERVRPELLKLGPAVLIGVSTDQPSTAFIPNALEEARLALDFSSVSERVVQYSDIPIRPIMLRAVRGNAQLTLPSWVDKFVAANDKSRGALAATLKAYADADMNVLKAAKLLSVHPNTIYARVQRIADLTGQNAFSFHELNELLLAIDCRQGLGTDRG